jgi:hypothetical protein
MWHYWTGVFHTWSSHGEEIARQHDSSELKCSISISDVKCLFWYMFSTKFDGYKTFPHFDSLFCKEIYPLCSKLLKNWSCTKVVLRAACQSFHRDLRALFTRVYAEGDSRDLSRHLNFNAFYRDLWLDAQLRNDWHAARNTTFVQDQFFKSLEQSGYISLQKSESKCGKVLEPSNFVENMYQNRHFTSEIEIEHLSSDESCCLAISSPWLDQVWKTPVQ